MKPDDRVEKIVELTGFSVASPIGFLAALGLLRVCSQDHGRDVRLSWSSSHARLHGLDAAALTCLLTEHMRGRSKAPEFNFQVLDDKGKRGPVMHLRGMTPADFRATAAVFRGNDRALGFLAGFGTDAVINDKGFVARTKFDFSSGQQKLAREFRSLAQALDPQAQRQKATLAMRIDRALFGGSYEEQHTFGWDPASLMTHAHLPSAPTDSTTPGQPMLVWLAVEALPLHPVVSVAPRRARTTGFTGTGTQAYVWPQWAEPLALAEVMLLRQRPVANLAQLPGVTAVWASSVTSVGKYGFLRPGARTHSNVSLSGGFAGLEVAEQSIS